MSPTRTTLLPAIGFVLGAGLVNVTALADDDPPDSITLTGIIRDFKELEIHSTGKPHRKKSLVQDKGQARMVREFIERIDQGGLPLISPAEIFAVTRATFAVQESLRTRQAVSL